MKPLFLLIYISFTSLSFAQEDVRNKVDQNKKVTPTTTQIDIGKHIFGHEYGVTEDQFIKKEGNPDGYLTLSAGRTVLIYGSEVGFIFKKKKLIGVRISNSIVDWELAKEIKSKSRFDGINWRIKQGVFSNMTKAELVKKFGDKLRGRDYEQFLMFGDDRLVIRYSSSQSNGKKIFTVHGVYLLHE